MTYRVHVNHNAPCILHPAPCSSVYKETLANDLSVGYIIAIRNIQVIDVPCTPQLFYMENEYFVLFFL
jgi:hypothetical protein